MKKMKEPKLIREINEIINNQDHWWTKCKQLTAIGTHNRPGSTKGESMIRDFFKTCAGKYQDRFETACVRPYIDDWWENRSYDHVNKIELNQDKSVMLGRNPRGIKLINKLESSERFENYLRRKYPEAFEEFEEIKNVKYRHRSATEKTNNRAWQHIFYGISRNYYGRPPSEKEWLTTTKDVQKDRRKLDLAIEKAHEDYKKLKKASNLPPRYLYNEVSLAGLQNNHKNHTYAIIGQYYITTETVLHYDSSNVSYGLGILSRTDRAIMIRNGKGIVFSKTLKTYAGSFVLNAIEECFEKVKKIKVHAELKPVQLNPKMKVVEIVNTDSELLIGFRVFKRLFAGTLYDYCVLRDGITYHDSSVENCVAGWEKKKELSKAGSKIFNMKILRDGFGFCKDGIRGFCSSNGLDSHETYTLSEVRRVVKNNLSYNKMYYGNELKQTGIL